MKKVLFMMMSALLIAFSAGCSRDGEPQIFEGPEVFNDSVPEEVRIDDCYTGIVKFVLDNGRVQVDITKTPENWIANGDGCPIHELCEVIFFSKELTDSILQVDDVIEFKIIEYKADIKEDGPTIFPRYWICKVKPCK